MKAMLRAYRSGLDMSELQYLEAHATSTQVGDATELETLGEVLGPKFPPGKKIPITSVKANIGHALEAAGVAGLIKTVLCMQHQTIPPAINIRTLNTKVDWQSSPYYIPMAPAPWSAPAPGRPRRAAVNAFGIGGLNMHVVIDEFQPEAARQLIQSAAPHPAAKAEDRAIAVVGMGCVFPGATGLEKFWNALQSGLDPKTAAPASRSAGRAENDIGQVAGFVTDFEYDWRKHKVPPKQVQEADPLQFMLLAAAEQALADAGYDRKPIEREKCGVVVGTEFGGDFCDHLEMGLRLPEMQDLLAGMLRNKGLSADHIAAINTRFADVLLKKWPSLVDETGSFTSSTLASRITKTLDLAGGAVAIDSGSTSAMSALSIAIDMLLSGDNDIMICAAGQRRMGPSAFNALGTAGLLAGPGGAKNLLDAGYDGVVPAEGVGVVVLKRLADARRDGDRIHAVIRGLGIAHAETSAEALSLAAERSCHMAGVDPSQIALAECDTDERLGSAGEELTALIAAHGAGGRAAPLLIGSATAQFGHLGGASGMLALMKTSLEVEYGQTAPAVRLQTAASALTAPPSPAEPMHGVRKLAGPRLGAIACWSKGLACHLILEDASGRPVVSSQATTAPAAKRPQAQFAAAAKAAHTGTSVWRICRFGGPSFAGLAAELNVAAVDAATAWNAAEKRQFTNSDRFRVAIVSDGPATLERKLKLAVPQLRNVAAQAALEQQGIFYRELPAVRPRVAFVFPGQGSQYDGMLAELVRDVPAAAAARAKSTRR